jgi:hypothetical protein
LPVQEYRANTEPPAPPASLSVCSNPFQRETMSLLGFIWLATLAAIAGAMTRALDARQSIFYCFGGHLQLIRVPYPLSRPSYLLYPIIRPRHSHFAPLSFQSSLPPQRYPQQSVHNLISSPRLLPPFLSPCTAPPFPVTHSLV